MTMVKGKVRKVKKEKSLIQQFEKELDKQASNGRYISDGISILLSIRNHSDFEIDRFQEEMDCRGFWWEMLETNEIAVSVWH